MLTALSTALTGLNAQGIGIDVVGNNLANLNTTGFKASSTMFDDLVSQNLGGDGNTQVGMGVAKPNTERIFSQGNTQTSAGLYDSAIQGDGLFVVNDSAGKQLYTRAGSFKVDGSGYLITPTGEKVQGYQVVSGQVSGSRGDIKIAFDKEHAPKETKSMTAGVNLDSTAPVLSPVPDPSAPPPAPTSITFNPPSYSTAAQVFDQKGGAHTLELDFWKSATGTWTVGSKVDGTAASSATVDIKFNPDGTLDTTGPTALNITTASAFSNGAPALNINWNLLDSNNKPTVSEYAGQSIATSLTQDGNGSGTVSHASIADGGYVQLTYSDGTTENVADVAIANFKNPDSLIAVGGNSFQVSGHSSTPLIQAAVNSSSKVLGGSLESSTVDIATEFTNLMVYQRSYQANAKVITSADQLNQDTINLIR